MTDGVDAVAARIRTLEKPALALDFDGTLVEIAPTPGSIRVPETLPTLLARLERRLAGRLALITGRAHADLSRHLDLTAFHAATSHGAQFSTAGQSGPTSLLDSAALDALRPMVARAASLDAALWVEDKGTALAVHTRARPDLQAAVLDALTRGSADRGDVSLIDGNGVVEMRLSAETKGTALDRLMRQPGWQGATPVMIGDDRTDDDAMAAACRHGGFGVAVGTPAGGAVLPHATMALATVPDVHAVLERLAG